MTILDDSSMEDAESFSLELMFDPFALEPSPSNVILSPNVSEVTILDDDEPTAGIYGNNYYFKDCRDLIISISRSFRDG